MNFSSALILMLALLPWGLVAQETLSQIQREMTRVEKEINREKKLHQLEKQKAVDFEKRKKEKLAALQKQLTDLDTRKSEIKGRVSALRGQKQNLQSQIKGFEAKQAEVTQHILGKIDELSGHFENDFPHQRQRTLESLNDLKAELKEGVASPEAAMGRLFTLLTGTLELGYEAEAYSGTYTDTQGKTHEGRYLRLGTVLLAFVSLDGNTVGYQVQTSPGYTWVDSDVSLDLKENIKQALQISEGKAPPELVFLPFRIPALGGEP